MKYKCEIKGSTKYKGKVIRFDKGEGDYPSGSLDHVGLCKRVTKKKSSQKSSKS